MGILYKWVHYDRERGPVDRVRNCTIMEERSAVLFVYLYNWKYFKNMKCETSQPMYM